MGLGEAAGYRSLGTMEFLVAGDRFVFIEGNARLQVEHTVTEEVTGLDLVRLQLQIAAGRSLSDLRLTQGDVPAPRGHAVQARVNLETMAADGSAKPAGGLLTAFEPPSGPGVRVDGFGYAGYRTGARFDSLLAKLIVHAGAGGLSRAVAKAYRALSESASRGRPPTSPSCRTCWPIPPWRRARCIPGSSRNTWASWPGRPRPSQALFRRRRAGFRAGRTEAGGRAGRRRRSLAVLALGKQEVEAAPEEEEPEGPEGTRPLRAPLQGTVINVSVAVGEQVRAGQALMIMEAMKMEHVIAAEVSGIVRQVTVEPGDTVFEDHPLVFLEEAEIEGGAGGEEEVVDLDYIRPDLAEVLERHRLTLDAARPEAVARRRKTGSGPRGENVEDLVDPGSFVEYGPLVVAARRRRHSLDELVATTPADGMLMGLASVNGDRFAEDRRAAPCSPTTTRCWPAPRGPTTTGSSTG